MLVLSERYLVVKAAKPYPLPTILNIIVYFEKSFHIYTLEPWDILTLEEHKLVFIPMYLGVFNMDFECFKDVLLLLD